MWQRVDTRSGGPLFEQIVDAVKSAIARGELGLGEKLPSVRELAGRLSVNPNTVVRAYGQLESEGLLVTRPGSGCFVQQGPSPLTQRVRQGRLNELFEATTTEAFHLGFDADAQTRALEAALAKLRFRANEGAASKAPTVKPRKRSH